jgi:hypothetical protein
MDLLDRYLQAVTFFLPSSQQDDIVRELSENLRSQIEDREEELGRALTEDEQAEILRRHGHPLVVAGRYRQHQYLVGPMFFPIYMFTLKIGLAAALAVTILAAAVGIALHGDAGGEALRAMLAYPGRALMVFAWTTLGFAGLDLAVIRLPVTSRWDPRRLPRVFAREQAIPRWRTLCELALVLSALVWLLLLPLLVLGPAAGLVVPAPIWWGVYPPIVVLTVAGGLLQVVNLWRPWWTRTRSVVRLLIQAATLFVFALLLRAGDPFAVPAAALDAGARPDFVTIVNVSFEIGFVVVIAACAVEIARELHRLRRLSRTTQTLAGWEMENGKC